MRNSEFILQALDDCLDRVLPVSLHLLGGAALDLVYGIRRFSEDVDCMCTLSETGMIDADWFQRAVASANERLTPHGLYLTHIFDETDLVHTQDWFRRIVSPPPEAPRFRHFRYDATSPEDIILSELTRFDEKDQQDVRDLMRTRALTKADIERLIGNVHVGEEWRETWEAGLRTWRTFDV
ncbi:MAG: hypothetical protein A3K19_12540 [Lentisphaerae bacterium RIFOXYB12_FULL_65_16]|nr:MAG: hypothetical protein A3K18_12135 [Lentisphaerae bacterium RIFOXYA12_64_32]OGV88111.1 MAG: hypothetical protein A3K19_12540 [Lentisphaerae bacterium RIFOXYB12_FULL_65_16]